MNNLIKHYITKLSKNNGKKERSKMETMCQGTTTDTYFFTAKSASFTFIQAHDLKKFTPKI